MTVSGQDLHRNGGRAIRPFAQHPGNANYQNLGWNFKLVNAKRRASGSPGKIQEDQKLRIWPNESIACRAKLPPQGMVRYFDPRFPPACFVTVHAPVKSDRCPCPV
jgi:hypothetical protein